ncbi:homocysteine S-methyltransferase family protein [Saccharibacter sp. 17.LH.SD]|uniref:homocysteine S-methyltransferase family protein n=1 Tax=Saccharibacter sp. 17.LH.SD TaxID=2689393 RepID=UPI001F26457A|nr:homocysteine S-methyltransferase family protein [Saccharibacter sp. 17.LH.SD]
MTILDGGMGRELHRIGAPFRQPEWSALALIKGPDFVKKAHRSFIEAGAHVITANNYAVVPYHIGEERFRTHGKDLIQLAGQLARDAIAEARKPSVRLAGSLPPVCGSYRPDLFQKHYAETILATLKDNLSPFVDLWLAETQSSIVEARIARRIIGFNDPRPFWLSFTLDDTHLETTRNETYPLRLRSGEVLHEAIKAALELRIDALLFNCSDPAVMLPALQEAQKVFAKFTGPHKPQLGVYANAFDHNHEKHDEANEVISALDTSLTTTRYRKLAQEWQKAGATIIGGCCGIGPDYIKELSHNL